MIINASSYTSAIPVAPSDTINIPGPSAKFTGATTAVINTSGYMRDTNANFVTTYNANGSINNEGVAPGMVVYNMYAMVASGINAPAVATVLEVVDNNTLLSLCFKTLILKVKLCLWGHKLVNSGSTNNNLPLLFTVVNFT